jgi:hypothetical protein
MSIFNYTLPSGASFQLNAPAGTTQAQADKIFYEQVAAGTFVGYNVGDTLTHPTQAFINFGLTRLERDTAGVSDNAILSVINGLPTVATLPITLTGTPITNPISTADYIQVTSNTTEGRFSLSPSAIGQLNPTQVQSLMGQMASVINQDPSTITQESGVGKYGFNAQQLEWAGYIKPGYADRYCALGENQTNPDNFVDFVNSTGIWTGKDGVTSIAQVNEATQNQIQQNLMQQGYTALVNNGTIIPPKAATTTPTVSTGQVYTSTGQLLTTTGLTLLASTALGYNGSNALFKDFTSLFSNVNIGNAFSTFTSNPLGSIGNGISSLGNSASSLFTAGLDSLQSGAVGFVKGAGNVLSGGLTQIENLAIGIKDKLPTLTSNLDGDVGALITNASKFGPNAATAWASSSTLSNLSLGNLGNSIPNLGSLSGSFGSLNPNLPNISGLTAGLSSNLDIFGKASQYSINFSNFSLNSLVSSVQPAAGFTNTVNRSTVDAALTRVIGTDKIPTPSYELPSLASLGITADINQAKKLLSSVSSTSSQGFGTGITG